MWFVFPIKLSHLVELLWRINEREHLVRVINVIDYKNTAHRASSNVVIQPFYIFCLL